MWASLSVSAGQTDRRRAVGQDGSWPDPILPRRVTPPGAARVDVASWHGKPEFSSW